MRPYFTLAQLAELTKSELIGNPATVITGVDDLESAGPEDASFLANPRYEKQLRSSKAGVVFVPPQLPLSEGKNFLRNDNPSLAFQKTIELFFSADRGKSGFDGIHPTAVIHQDAKLGEGIVVGPHAVIDRGCEIGEGTIIDAHVSIGADVVIGKHCHLHAHATVRECCELGDRVILQPGAVIGSCGFGYITDEKGQHHKLRQVGKVIIEDDVEIGANTTIDRARFKITRIGRGTKIDNLVQIAHQVTLGESNLIVAQVGIAGSSKTGRNVVMGGQVGVVGHLSIADGVMLAARTAVSKSLPPGIYGGAPAVPIKEFNEQIVYMKQIGKYAKRVQELEKKIQKLEEASAALQSQ